jgi:hypothetical protein
MNNVPRRENVRPQHMRRSVIVSSAEIEDAVRASGIQDDDETTGTMGIRDNKDLRKNADKLRKGK